MPRKRDKRPAGDKRRGGKARLKAAAPTPSPEERQTVGGAEPRGRTASPPDGATSARDTAPAAIGSVPSPEDLMRIGLDNAVAAFRLGLDGWRAMIDLADSLATLSPTAPRSPPEAPARTRKPVEPSRE